MAAPLRPHAKSVGSLPGQLGRQFENYNLSVAFARGWRGEREVLVSGPKGLHEVGKKVLVVLLSNFCWSSSGASEATG